MLSKLGFGLMFSMSLVAVSVFQPATAKTSWGPVKQAEDWSVFVGDNPKECWAVTTPKEGLYRRNLQGERLLQVFIRPDQTKAAQVAVKVGYNLKRVGGMELLIGEQAFSFLGTGEWAWPANSTQDASVIKALMRGDMATFKVYEGNKTDWYKFSLKGLTVAFAEAQSRCRK